VTVADGWADRLGGGIYNSGSLTLIESGVRNNSANNWPAGYFRQGGRGGGIYNSGSLTLIESAVRDNLARWGYEANDLALGGGIHNSGGTIILYNSVVNNNTVADGNGGGIYNLGGTLTVNYSTFRHNYADGGGAAIASFGGTLTIYASTLDDNLSNYRGTGGAIYSFSDTSTIIKSTISNNTVLNRGGGINIVFGEMTIRNSGINGNYSTGSSGAIHNNATLTINNSTISGNAGGASIENLGTLALNDSTVSKNEAGIRNWSTSRGATTTVANSIIAENVWSSRDVDVVGSFDSLGNNLIGDGSYSTGFGTTDDQVGTYESPIDPLLGPLQDNGGPTQTHALLSGSPAIDAGNNSLIPAGTVTDQRGFRRIANGTVDIGAYEFGDGVLVALDIKPGEVLNSINPTSGQKIPVAILTTNDFDAQLVDPMTVRFGPGEASEAHKRWHVEDVDEDGDLDLLFHFNTQDTGIACGALDATLTGDLFSGEPITGTEAVVTVNCD
jgi:hypothetical protein